MGLFQTDGTAGIDRAPVMLAYGAGADSTAMLCWLALDETFPDATLFADTGGEKPQTYEYLFRVDEWMASRGFPKMGNVWHRSAGYEATGLPATHELACLRVVRNDGKYGTLERNCLEQSMLPSIAYGYKGCSEKYKQRPQHKWAKSWEPARLWWNLDAGGRRRPKGRSGLVTKLIGYNADETHRSATAADDFYRYLYPLRKWEMGREAVRRCVEASGLPRSAKSACFFCPSSTKPEIRQLALQWPGLMGRALAMEANAKANLDTVQGLGRRFSWQKLMDDDAEALAAIGPVDGMGCVCQGEVFHDEGTDLDEEEMSLPPAA